MQPANLLSLPFHQVDREGQYLPEVKNAAINFNNKHEQNLEIIDPTCIAT